MSKTFSFFSIALGSLLFFAIFIAIPPAQAAKFYSKIDRSNDGDSISCVGHFYLTDGIEKGDAEKFYRIVQKRLSGCTDYMKYISVFLHSSGGDVNEAILLGQIIRKEALNTVVRPNDKCESACVIIFAGGITKTPNGQIGIHRPYFGKLTTNESVEQIRVKREQLNKNLKAYFESMDVNPSLVDIMLATPPEEMKVLNANQLKFYRLEGKDANHEEKEIAERAEMYGTTSSIIRQRIQKANSCLTSQEIKSSEIDCYSAAMWGMPLSLYKQRKSVVDSKCSKFAIANDVRGYNACKIATMTGK